MFTYSNDVKRQELGGGVFRKVLSHDKEMMAVEVAFEKDAVGAVHTHPHIQISYVLEGKFRATIGDETAVIRTGDTYFVPADVPHGVVCLEGGKLLDVFTPEREDFLK